MAEGEVSKLQNHLGLLREEYVKLQERLAEVEKKYQVALASLGQSADSDDNNFVPRLLRKVADLFNKEIYSDITILLEGGQKIKAHKFILQSRTDDWACGGDFSEVSELDFSAINFDVAYALLKWVYTDQINIQADETFLLDLLKSSVKFKLHSLCARCENALMSFVNMKNCIKFYQSAEEMGADILKNHCSELISNHWNDFTSEDFVSMPAPLLYKMFKSKSEHVLHTAIRAQREDVVFLYLIEYDSQLSIKLNELDSRGDIPLDMALQSRQESIANTLVNNKADVNRRDKSGRSLLHKAIKRGDEFSSTFLIHNKVDINAVTHLDQESPLHMVASFHPENTDQETIDGMARVCQELLQNGANINAQCTEGSTPLHRAITCKNVAVFDVLLKHGGLSLELKNSDSYTALWLALQCEEQNITDDQGFGEESFAAKLLKAGSSVNTVNSESGDSLLMQTIRSGNEAAGIFLAMHGALVNTANHKNETALHVACEKGLVHLVQVLLSNGANPNTQTSAQLNTLTLDDEEQLPVTKQTPLHLAILSKREDIVDVFLQHKAKYANSNDSLMIVPNFNLKDSQGQSVLGLALWNNLHSTSIRLLSAGANINETNTENLTLLHQALLKQDIVSALFLLDHQVDTSVLTPEGDLPLQLAIKRHLPVIVEALCAKGVNMNIVDVDNNSPLWLALDSGQEDIAHILVKHGCDVDMWGPGPEGCYQNLLHRAIDENNESVACFLIRSACDKNSPRRPGPNGEGGEEARDGQTPLHLACAWGLELVVQCLMEHGADVNIQDADGNCPLHIAIQNQHSVIISLLLAHPNLNLSLKNRQGYSPFAVAMMTKNNKAAQAILNREPTAAEQTDNKGRNFLHTAITNGDIESVLFLISVHANVNSRVQDAHQHTPLHLAVLALSEIIVRNLLLAGANVNDRTLHGETALHLAATNDNANISTALIENGVDIDALDENSNNALHIAVQHSNLHTIRCLLTESNINAEALNGKGQNSLHVLSQYGKDNAAAIFELFREAMPDYPIDQPDLEGNTAMLLAYINGNGTLCRALVKANTCLGATNRHGCSIFNATVASKQLLFNLLDMLSKEPPWCDGENCLECGVKFGIKTRKHHCRHCGRLLCAKCSTRDMPIVKYNLSKPVRVCDICFDVLSLGGSF